MALSPSSPPGAVQTTDKPRDLVILFVEELLSPSPAVERRKTEKQRNVKVLCSSQRSSTVAVD